MLKSPDGDYLQVTNPGFEAITTQYNKDKTPDADGKFPAPIAGERVGAFDEGATGGNIAITPSKPSKNLGLGSASIGLAGGTDGGMITLDQLSSITIGKDGKISVSHPDKGLIIAGKVSLANFSNPAGLELTGTNYYAQTANSGEPVLCDPGTGGTGSLVTSALEMSNVDLSEQFSEMITTQRGFQACSRIITVTDTMLEELINLKR